MIEMFAVRRLLAGQFLEIENSEKLNFQEHPVENRPGSVGRISKSL